MITNNKQLHQAVEQLGRMYRALTALRTEIMPVNVRHFAVMAEGPLDEIQRLQGEIDSYATLHVRPLEILDGQNSEKINSK